MIFQPTESLRVVSDAAATTTEPDFYTAWVDVDDAVTTTPIFDPQSEDGVLTGLTPVVIISAPTAPARRQAKFVNVFNVDTVAHVFVFDYWDGVNSRIVARANVPVNGRVTWEPGGTWHVYDANGQLLLGAAIPTLHAVTHENGGSDEINVAGLSGVLADAQNPVQATEILVGGAEIATQAETDAGTDDTRMVTPLKLASTTLQLPPAAHGSTHENGGSDEIDVGGLSGLLADAQTALAHAASHISSGADPIAVFTAALTGLVPASGGGTTNFLRADGTFAVPAGAGLTNDHFEAYDSTGGQAYAPFPGTVVDLDTVRVNSNGAIFTWTPGTDVLTITQTGTYLFIWRVSGDSTDTSRSTGSGYLQEDPLGFSSFGNFVGTDAFSYHRTTGVGHSTACGGAIRVVTTVTHQFRLIAEEVGGSGIITLANGSALVVVRLT